MNIPCDRRIDCPGDDSPIRNYSAEGPDSRLFCRMGYFSSIPKIGQCWERTGCAEVACSLVSTAQAQLEATQAAAECVWSTWSTPSCPPDPNGIPPTQPPPQEPPREPITIYRNTRQSCVSYCPDGAPFTYTIPAGRYSAQSQAEADAAALSEARRLATIHLLCVSSPSSPTCAGQAYVSVITATGAFAGTGGAWVLVSGTLPPGLTFAGGTAPTTVISGTPTVAGVYTFTIRYTLTNGDFIQKATGIRVMQITTTSLPDADSSPYSATLTETGGEITTWAVVSGSLPPGLTLTGDTISGTATSTGVFPFTIGLYDGGGLVCTKNLSITCGSCTYDMQVDWTPAGYALGDAAAYTFSSSTGTTSVTSTRTASPFATYEMAGIGFFSMNDLVSADFNSLVTEGSSVDAGGSGIVFSNCPSLTSIGLNALTITDGLAISGTSIVTLTVPSLASIRFNGIGLNITGNAYLQTISMASLSSVWTCQVNNNPALTTISIPSWHPNNGAQYFFQFNALSQATVDALLIKAAATLTFGAGSSLLLDGGTSAHPSAAGIAAAGVLTGRGVIVGYN